MTPQALEKLMETKPHQIGKAPVIVLPLADWKKVESILEEYQMSRSKSYRRSIAIARRQMKHGKLYELDLSSGKFKKIHRP